MSSVQSTFILLFGLFSLASFFKAFYECSVKKNSFGETPFLLPIGAFVWGDAVIFGIFWALVAGFVLFLGDWHLFLLIVAVFWLVRSVGETIYWLNEQFSTVVRNPPEKFWFYKFFHNDSVWFVLQIFWQCVTVVSLISALYFAHLWLQ